MLPNKDQELKASVAVAMRWVSEITSVVFVMTLPALGGIWADHAAGTQCVFTILGAICGFSGGMYALLSMVKANPKKSAFSTHPLDLPRSAPPRDGAGTRSLLRG
jgi:hypothetical protein